MYKLESSADYYLGSISCFGFSLGLLANLTVLSHLLSKSWQRSKMRGSSFARASMPSHYSHVITTRDLLLVMLAITDMITTLVHIISGITLLRTDTGLFKYGEFCITWGMLWNISIRLSAFTIMLLAIDILQNMRKRVVVSLFLGYLLLQIVQCTMPFWKGYSYKYSKFKEICTWGNMFTVRSYQWMAYNMTVEILEFLLPNTITLIVVFKHLLCHRTKTHTPLSHDGTERDTDFLYNPFQDTSSRSSDKPSLTSQLSQTSRLTSPPPQTSRRTALSLPLVYTFLALPHILIAVLEFSQTVQGTQYVFSSFPPNLGQIKMYGVLFYSVGVAARAWVNPVVFLIGEWRRVFSKCYRQR